MRELPRSRQWGIAVLICLLAVLIQEQSALTAPYTSYSYDAWSEPRPSPPPYLPLDVIDGRSLGVGPLNGPRDLCVSRDKIYIADTGNNRIICVDFSWKVLEVIDKFEWAGSTDRFGSPMGVAVGPNDAIYVADTNNSRIVVLDAYGECLGVIGRPQSDVEGVVQSNLRYRPRKLGVSASGMVYVVADDVYDGLMVFDPQGAFQGYIGAPRVTPSISDVFWSKIATREQRERMQLFIPTEFSNIHVDRKGFIYATVASVGSGATGQVATGSKQMVRLLNPAGSDVLVQTSSLPPTGDHAIISSVSGVPEGPSVFTDVVAREYGTFSVLDARRGRVFTYDQNSNLLYVFGGLGDVRGMFRSPVALDVIGDYIVVLDSANGDLTVFEPTTYAKVIHAAIALNEHGMYSESAKAWMEVLRQNANLELAYSGIGRAHLLQDQFADALRYFRLGNDRKGFSRALRLCREQWVRDRFGVLASGLVVLGAALFVVMRVRARRAWDAKPEGGKRESTSGQRSGKPRTRSRFVRFLAKLRQDLGYALHVTIHPFEGFWDVKYGERGSLVAAVVVVFCVVATYVLVSQYTGFVFNRRDLSKLNLMIEIASVLIPFVLWCLVNWCLTTLVEGKGNLAEVFVATAYSLIPLVLVNIPAMALSNILTLEEGAFYYMLLAGSVVWSAALLIIGHAVIHEFDLFKTVVVSALTVGGIGLVLFISLLFFALVDQVAGFVFDLYAEALFRI